jgi:hypothetical protein
MDGFCRGCGAPLSSGEPAIPVRPADEAPLGKAAAKPVASGVSHIFQADRLTSKNVWVAGLLTLLLGPPGMLYSTPIGALVMSILSVPVWFLGGWAMLADWAVCIFWAVMAARD